MPPLEKLDDRCDVEYVYAGLRKHVVGHRKNHALLGLRYQGALGFGYQRASTTKGVDWDSVYLELKLWFLKSKSVGELG